MTFLGRLAVSSTAVETLGASPLLDNDDLRPTPPEKRTWGFLEFNLFWLAAVTNVSNWLGGSSFLSFGLSFWEGVGCSVAGYALISLVMTVNGRAGSVYHIGFPVYCRSSFGVYGAAWPVVNRSLMAILWNGVNSVSGAQCLYVLLHAIFPSIVNVPNHMPSGSALTTMGMVCFFLFIFATAVTLLLPVHRWPLLFHIKLVVFTVSAIGMLALGITLAGGAGPIVTRKSTVTGSTKSWLIVRFIFTSAASCSTFASNASDWQRNAKKPSDPILGQILGFPLANLIVQVIGMIVASTSQGVYGTLYWNPVTYLDQILTDNYTAKYRAGAFFIAAGFTYSLLFSCVIENVYCCGNDLASLCPKFISIKRGFFICLAGTMIINPWYLLGSASIFITVISSYQIFLFSIIGILLVDYFIVAKGELDINQLFSSQSAGKYYYTRGVNLRAIVAYLVGITPNFAGFLSNFGIGSLQDTRLQHSYYFAIFTTIFAAGFTYYLLVRLFPQPNSFIGQSVGWKEPKGIWEPENFLTSERSSVDDLDEKEKEGSAAVQAVLVNELA